MTISVEDAKALLDSVTTLDELKALVAQLRVDNSSNMTTLLYSGVYDTATGLQSYLFADELAETKGYRITCETMWTNRNS
jgi:hypothetical protein